MKLIVGLGNPGTEYEKTRHNAGFHIIDLLLKELNLELDKSKCKAKYTVFRHNGEKVIIAKPQTYMNLSGEAVISLMKFYDIDIKDVIVVHDDLDLPVGKLRLRHSGSCGGQNGMRNIIDLTGTKDINRIRIGISNNKLIDTKDYVLSRFSKEELESFEAGAIKAKNALLYALDNSFEDVMNKFN
ncbi:MAG: aminoacyl-tRNA hydrolase [Firmicutes bacterium]|nr:aminoacyl-tRNA hydrolase [Candidatus Colivicinus equi]